jgi:hypothetical protein
MKHKKKVEKLEKAMQFAQKHRTIPETDVIWQAGIMDAVWQEGPYHEEAVRKNGTDRLLRGIIVLATCTTMVALLLCGYEYYRSGSMIEQQLFNDPAKLTVLAMNQ